MAIEGLRVPEMRNTYDDIGATVEALEMLGLVEDKEQVTETVTADFVALDESGKKGEKFVQLPRSVITLADIVRAMDGATYPEDREYPETYIYHNLWTPGTDPGGYSPDEIGSLGLGQKVPNWPAHARLAIHGNESSEEPLLHFLGRPFDDKYAEQGQGQETQLAAIAKAKGAYEAEHEGFAMTPLNASAVAMIALTRRIRGEAMPMEWGFMRDATLPRKSVDGGSFVGRVRSFGSEFRLRGSDGYVYSVGGVGLSVGRKLEAQTS